MSRFPHWVKISGFLTGILTVCLLLCVPAFASDYALKEAHFKYNVTKGTVLARWYQVSNRETDVTNYKIKVYLNGSKIVMDWKVVNQTEMDVAPLIARYGKGSYQFAVYPAKGTEEMQILSQTLSVDESFLTNIKNSQTERKDGEDENYINGIDENGDYMAPGWYTMPDGNYQYRDEDHKLVRSCFKDIDGITYYFSKEGLTLTGWQVIDQIWYYLGSEGQLYKDTVTPDGCMVNDRGQWIEEDGTVIKANEPVSASISTKTITLADSVSISVSERAQTVGDLYKISFANPAYGKITELDYSREIEDCEPGDQITICMTIHAYAGCTFCDWTDIYVSSKLQLSSYQVSNREISCEFIYTVGKQLAPITSAYTTDDYVLEWDDVPDAFYYYVSVSSSIGSSTQNVYDSCFNYKKYAGVDGTKITIKAYPYNKKERNIKESTSFVWTLIDDDFMQDTTIPGQLRTNDAGKLYYLDEFGERVKDQTIRLGTCYYTFDENGFALETGWHTDADGNQFYYDEHHRMVLGDKTIEGTKYHFNAGENLEKPVGALLK